jgi:hypothetical protein
MRFDFFEIVETFAQLSVRDVRLRFQELKKNVEPGYAMGQHNGKRMIVGHEVSLSSSRERLDLQGMESCLRVGALVNSSPAWWCQISLVGLRWIYLLYLGS